MSKPWQQPLPPVYTQLSEAELRTRIAAAKAALGKRLVILGHHYQQDPIIDYADYTGDSLELSRRAAEQKDAEFVVFCGVHFMAETADILTADHVKVILPDLGAGCSMADMADIDQARECWEQLVEICAGQTIVPITYVNSSAAIKAFVGERGGAVCTSSNCRSILEWALAQRSTGLPPVTQGSSPRQHAGAAKTKVLFLPDQHLGRNTAYAMGYRLDRMVAWDPAQHLGGNTSQQLRDADFVLWKGHCSVHALFRPEHVAQIRSQYPAMKVIVHPECSWEVVQASDVAGSTAYIVKQVNAAPPGSQWAIGTEVNLVNRLARQHPEQKIIILSGCQCLCSTMFRIDLPHLCWALENLVQGNIVNQIKVDAQTRKLATVALERMLAVKSQPTAIIPDRVAVATR
jgi:quinolinate synthase